MSKELFSAILTGAGCDRSTTDSGRNRAAFAADYLPPELTVTECAAERGFAVSAGTDPMIEDPWEDL